MIEPKRIQRPRFVLVVDDFEINRDAIGVILEDDFEVIYAENGQEALDLMYEHAAELSIVLLDLMMPVMTGFEVLERVGADEKLKHIPIIVLTADKSAELQALQLGAVDFITKPFDVPEIILARVSRVIELSEGRQLISAAERDRLTMLYSRNFFLEYANRLYQYHPDMHMDAVVVDIEQFHSVNELMGRDLGDEVLRLIGSEIRAFLAESEGVACRFEADRFDIYCMHQDDYQVLFDRLEQRANTVSRNAAVHLRMGVNLWHEGTEPIVMFDHARAACNMVRGNYQSPLMVYDDEMRERELYNQRLISELRNAIEQRQLQVYFQPKYSIQSDPPRLASAEALIRWIHPELGMISPGDFIPLFEENGLISIVDEYVWQEAARQVAEWRDRYGFVLPVSVNLSRVDVCESNLVEKLRSLIEGNGLSFQDIKLEVTESAYTENANQLLAMIDRLHTVGFLIEMDDFGSGYSSLNTLSKLPIDVLKMDMKFINNIENSETDLRLVKLIVDIARYLNLVVIAEGVETKGQLDLLREVGCDMAQGYYFSRPLPADEFEKLIENDMEIERN